MFLYPAVPRVPEEKKPDPEVLRKIAFERARDGLMKEFLDVAATPALYMRQGCHEGAVQAFFDGEPDKVQAIMADPGTFSLDLPVGEFVSDTLRQLTEGQDLAAEIMTVALAQVDKDSKRDMLTATLLRTVRACTGTEDKPFIEALIKAGASTEKLAQTHTGDVPYEIVKLWVKPQAPPEPKAPREPLKRKDFKSVQFYNMKR